LPLTSREIVDGARPSRRAIEQSDAPPARPREISSRSTSDSRSGDRFDSGFRGRSSLLMYLRIAHRDRPISVWITHAGVCAAHSSATRSFSRSDNRSTPHLPIRSNPIQGAVALIP
jgi:hypothetical protein